MQGSFENKDQLRPVEIKEARHYAKGHGITFRSRKAFPQFVRYRPYRYPWYLQNTTEEQHLYEAFLATIEVAGKLKTTSKSYLSFVAGAPYHREIPLLETNGDCYTWGTMELPPRQGKSYPSPMIHDDLLVARVKKLKKKNMVWACEVILLHETFSALMEMDQETLRCMPPELLDVIRELDRQGALPEDIAVRFQRIW